MTKKKHIGKANFEFINFEADSALIEEAKQIKQKTRISLSQMARDGFRKEIAELKRTRPELQEAETIAA